MDNRPVSFPEGKTALARSPLLTSERATFRREILGFLHHCKFQRVPATPALMKQYLVERERRSAGPAASSEFHNALEHQPVSPTLAVTGQTTVRFFTESKYPIGQKQPMRILFALLLLTAAASSRCFAGVTIHYSAKAASPASIARVLEAAEAFATKKQWTLEDASTDKAVLRRIVKKKEQKYVGRVRGVCIRPAPRCEPLFIQFGDDLVMQDFVKTQFAGADVHIAVVELFETLRPLLKTLEIIDEGKYWGVRDRSVLLRNLEAIDLMLAHVKNEHPDAKGPIFLENGRIIDVGR